MDYSLLKKIAADKRVSLKRLAVLIEMTEGGFFSAIRNDTLSCQKLEKCAEILGCSICDFFNCTHDATNPNQSTDEYREKYFDLLQKDHARLELIMKLTDEINQHKKNHR